MGIKMKEYRIRAYAKINLGLDVVKKLPNGYHQVKMIMQTVGICDELSLERTQGGIAVTTDSKELSAGEDNLVYKAAALMREKYKITEGVRICLKKRIPIAAGMAGGSSDAAAVMKGMNKLFDLGIERQELMKEGASIGADVPYCILGGTALAQGIGEELTVLNKAPECRVLVAKPDISVSTRYVYEHLDAVNIEHHPDIDGMAEAVRAGNLQGILERLENVLETVTIPAYPVIGVIKERMRQLGAAGSLMSGSGPTVFGIFLDEQAAGEAARRLRGEKLAKDIYVTEFCYPKS